MFNRQESLRRRQEHLAEEQMVSAEDADIPLKPVWPAEAKAQADAIHQRPEQPAASPTPIGGLTEPRHGLELHHADGVDGVYGPLRSLTW
jgi:hypothetical protein